MKLKLRRRDVILIAGFWIIGCALLGVVFYFTALQTGSTPSATGGTVPQATYTLAFNQITAKTLQPATQNQIALWKEDAQLFTVSATWQETQLEQVGRPAIWTYRFYSPSLKRFYFVTVSPEGDVTGISHSERVRTPPQTINPDDWVVDSSEAINMWLNNGGAAMLAAMPGIQVITQLQISAPDAPLTWTVAGYDRISKNYHTVFINATTNQIINIETSLN